MAVSYNYGMNYPGQNAAAYGQQGYGQQVMLSLEFLSNDFQLVSGYMVI